MAQVQYHSQESTPSPLGWTESPGLPEPGKLPAGGLEAWPLSLTQERFWLLQESVPALAPRFNVAALIRLRGPLNAAALDKALNLLLTRHDILRTRFACLEDGPVQIVDEQATLRPYFRKLS